LARAFDLVDGLSEVGVWFAPVRHHSPACARAVGAAIDELAPAAVLIEGPAEYDHLIPALLDQGTVPPVAILSQHPSAEGTTSSLYPLADFSPEWMALRRGAAAGSRLAFIDRDWDRSEFASDAAVRLSGERHYHVSAALTALAAREHCRDADELWEHLFELRPPGGPWADLFRDALAWGALPRLEQPVEALIAEGSIDREAAMARHIAAWRQRTEGALVVVTGAFHTIALVEVLATELGVGWDRPVHLDALPATPRAGAPARRPGPPEPGAIPEAPTPGATSKIVCLGPGAVPGPPEPSPTSDTGPRGPGATHQADPSGPGAMPEAPATGASLMIGPSGPGAMPEAGSPRPGPALEAAAAEVAAIQERLRQRSPAPAERPSWLIRYDLTALNSLSGYGAGIRSPGYHQRLWDSQARGEQDPAAAGRQNAIDCLIAVAHQTQDSNHQISIAEVSAAAVHCARLAELRGHPYPSRLDLLDAALACFAKGDFDAVLRDGIGQVFGGNKLGQLPPGTAAPPIVAEARERARGLKLNIVDSTSRTVDLDLRRSASARRRSRFFWLMSYLDTGFATRLVGPDFLTGRALGRLRERWRYAWTPLVEASLIGLLEEGSSLEEAGRRRLARSLEENEAAAGGGSAAAVAQAVAQAALIGLHDEVWRYGAVLESVIDADSDVTSVLSAAWRLLGLMRAREVLDLTGIDRLADLITRLAPQLVYLLGGLHAVDASGEEAVVQALIGMVELTGRLGDPGVTALVDQALAGLRSDPDASAGPLGAAVALGVVQGSVPQDLLATRFAVAFAPGAALDFGPRFLNGVLQAAPDLLFHTAELFDAVDAAVRRLEPDDFLAVLPQLRRGFGRLRPFETARLAERVARDSGLPAASLTPVWTRLTSADLAFGQEVEVELRASLSRDCLAGWLDQAASGNAGLDRGRAPGNEGGVDEYPGLGEDAEPRGNCKPGEDSARGRGETP
jgi:hypothetical protein